LSANSLQACVTAALKATFGLSMIRNTFLLLFSVYAAAAFAEFDTDSPLSFGEIAIRHNNSVSTTTMSRNGMQTSTNQIYIIRPGTPGIYTLSGLPPYTTVNLSVDLPAYSAMAYPGTAQFQINAVDIPSSINMGNTGVAQFRLGATLSTSGNPAENYYSGADYTVFLNLNLVY
jgi:hypothetical protein